MDAPELCAPCPHGRGVVRTSAAEAAAGTVVEHAATALTTLVVESQQVTKIVGERIAELEGELSQLRDGLATFQEAALDGQMLVVEAHATRVAAAKAAEVAKAL